MNKSLLQYYLDKLEYNNRPEFLNKYFADEKNLINIEKDESLKNSISYLGVD